MHAVDWLPVLTLGALLGAVGQVLRTIPGLKKLKDEPDGQFDAAQLMMSVIIGAAAGVAAMITLEMTSGTEISTQDIITVIASGYTGADFIEAFITKKLSSGGGLPQQKTVPVALVPGSPGAGIPTPDSLIGAGGTHGAIPPTGTTPPGTAAVG